MSESTFDEDAEETRDAGEAADGEEVGLQGPEDVRPDARYEGPSDTSPGNVGGGSYS